MGLQTAVNIFNTIGIPGNLAFDGPLRSAPYNLNSSGQAQVCGYAFTQTAGANPNPAPGSSNAGSAQVGGTGVFAGILVNPKEQALYGASGIPLNPSLTIPDNGLGDLLTMGQIFIILGNTANPGDLAYYDNTTGAIGSVSPSSSFTGVVATNTLTVTGFVAGGAPLGIGSVISGTGVPVGIVVITALGSGTGGNGTYTVSGPATIASTTMSGSAVAPSGKTFIPSGRIDSFSVTAANSVAVLKITQ